MGLPPNFVPTNDSKVGWWRPFWTMKSNLNHASPFIILIMRQWSSQAAVILCKTILTHTILVFKKGTTGQLCPH
eukprot:scaffold62008_cov54-Cyclotella_meneghiniana.AAC.1